MAVSGHTTERSIAWRVPGLDGLELMRASFRTQTFPRHFHEGYALGVIESGALAFRYQGADLVAAPGEVNLVVPGLAHDGRAATERGWAYRMLYLDPALPGAVAAELGRPGLPHFHAGVLRDPALARDLLALHRLLESGADRLAAQSGLLALLAAWITRHADDGGTPPRAGAEPRAVALAREFLAARCAGDPDLAETARVAGLSPFHFLRVFRKATGLTPHAFLVQCRVRRAQELLRGGLDPASVAAETGFADQSHLTRQFKRLTGVTPAAYRNSLQDR
ncbi:AraC family ligand binding domain-containing protein [Desulfovibrio sp.]